MTNLPPTNDKPIGANIPRTNIAAVTADYAAVSSAAPGQTLPSDGADRTIVDSVDADALLADAQRRKKIEDDLRRMGLSPIEVQRLLNADSHSFDATIQELSGAATANGAANKAAALPVSTPIPMPAAKPARASLQSMQSFAAELMAQKAAQQVQAVREVKLDLPAFRESSSQEVRQAEPILRDAAMLRRKEKFREAEIKVREALQLVPKDAAALELLGDILQGVARVDEALAVYKRALESDPKRSSSERKYGELLVLQQNWDMSDPEAMRGSSKLAIMLSFLLPGLGQFHNGEIAKGIFFLVLDALCVYLLAYSPFGFGGAQGRHGLSIGLMVCIVFTVVVYIYALIDTKQHGHGKQGRGWEI